MNIEQSWQSVLGQLQMEMPRASFDTWVRDTQVVSLEGGTLTISVRNVYARDWLESRLTSTVSRLLVGIMNQSVTVRFVVMGTDGEGEFESEEEELEDDTCEDDDDLALEPVGWLDYDQIVQPHKQVVVKGYLRRLAMEIGPKAIWLYIGFHQAAWMSNAQGGSNSLRSWQVRRFSGLSFGAFWRLMKQPEVQKHLTGLVERLDPPGSPPLPARAGRAPASRAHSLPGLHDSAPDKSRCGRNLYTACKTLLKRGATLPEALEELAGRGKYSGTAEHGRRDRLRAETQCNTVMDIARDVSRRSAYPRGGQTGPGTAPQDRELPGRHPPDALLHHAGHPGISPDACPGLAGDGRARPGLPELAHRRTPRDGDLQRRLQGNGGPGGIEPSQDRAGLAQSEMEKSSSAAATCPSSCKNWKSRINPMRTCARTQCHVPSECCWTSRWTQMEVIGQSQMEVIWWSQMEVIASRKWKH